MTTNTVKNVKMTTESVVNFVFFETLTTEKYATGVGSNKKRNHNTYRGVMILSLDPDTDSDFQPFGNSGSGFGSSKRWMRNTSNSNFPSKNSARSRARITRSTSRTSS